VNGRSRYGFGTKRGVDTGGVYRVQVGDKSIRYNRIPEQWGMGGRTVDYRLPVPTLALGLVVVELGAVFVFVVGGEE
jgi:hypothetical protein